jgi:hypothetical protein
MNPFLASFIVYDADTGLVSFNPSEVVIPIVLGLVGIVAAVASLWCIVRLVKALVDSISVSESMDPEVSERQRARDEIITASQMRARQPMRAEPVDSDDDERSDWEFRDGGRYDGY